MKHHLKFRDWIDVDKIDWGYLSYNPNAIYLLEQNQNKITENERIETFVLTFLHS